MKGEVARPAGPGNLPPGLFNDDLSAVLDTLPIGVLISLDPECRRVAGNRAACALLRMPAGANLAITALDHERPNFRIFVGGREESFEAMPMLRAARGEIVRDMELEIRFDDGDRIPTLISASPLYDEDNRPRGAVASLQNVSELKRAEQALRLADRRKDEFLAVLAHELRNPLAPLRTGLDLLKHDGLSGHAAGRTREMMQRQLNHLVRLVDDLLDLSRVSRGAIELRQGHLDLNKVVEEAVEISRPLITERSHRLELALEKGQLPIEGDFERLIQVVGNLLGNAARYTEPGGTLHIRSETSRGEALLRVRDTGAGIPSELQEEIFEMFTQAPGQSGTAKGLGIGLAIARQLIRLHGGDIEVRSEGRGRGSEFIVRLPLGTLALDLEPPPAAEDEQRSGRRVLVVDDNVDAADTLGLLLELQGHSTTVVNDGRAALDALESLEPEIVLLDIGLPGMDGYEVARHIRRTPGGDRMLLVAVTGWGQQGDRDRAREAGFDEHVTKPVDLESLQRLLRTRKSFLFETTQ